MGESLQLWRSGSTAPPFRSKVALSPWTTDEQTYVIATVRDVGVRLGIQAELEAA